MGPPRAPAAMYVSNGMTDGPSFIAPNDEEDDVAGGTGNIHGNDEDAWNRGRNG